MTWVVGMPTTLGYSLGISDIRVTVGSAEFDCLQKIYPVGRFLALGFAGSVKIGFSMIDRLTELLTGPADSAWNPIAVAEWWQSDAKAVFDSHTDEQKNLGCELMLISADPFQNAGDVPWAMSYVHIFRSPDFASEMARPSGIVSIGSGSAFPACQEAVAQILAENDETANLTLMESGVPGNIATVLGFRLTEILQQAQPSGISAHLNYCWAYRGRVVIRTNDHARFGRQWTMMSAGSGILGEEENPQDGPFPGGTVFEMPPLAKSWNELQEMLNQIDLDAEGCMA